MQKLTLLASKPKEENSREPTSLPLLSGWGRRLQRPEAQPSSPQHHTPTRRGECILCAPLLQCAAGFQVKNTQGQLRCQHLLFAAAAFLKTFLKKKKNNLASKLECSVCLVVQGFFFFLPKNRRMILKGEGKNLPAFKYFIHAVFRATAYRQVQNRQKSHCPQSNSVWHWGKKAERKTRELFSEFKKKKSTLKHKKPLKVQHKLQTWSST